MALFARKNKNAPAANDPNGTAVANAVATPPDTSSNGAVVNGAAVNGAAFSSDDEDALFGGFHRVADDVVVIGGIDDDASFVGAGDAPAIAPLCDDWRQSVSGHVQSVPQVRRVQS